MAEETEYNPQLCKERHDNINEEFTNVWYAVKEAKDGVNKMNKQFIAILIGVIFNLIGVAGILTTVALGG